MNNAGDTDFLDATPSPMGSNAFIVKPLSDNELVDLGNLRVQQDLFSGSVDSFLRLYAWIVRLKAPRITEKALEVYERLTALGGSVGVSAFSMPDLCKY
jgi:hypothetical protein